MYQLRRNGDNPKDTNCFEVRSQYITMAPEEKSITGKDSQISFHDEHDDITFTLLFYFFCYWIIVIIRININSININPSCPV